MPVRSKKIGNKFCVVDKTGKKATNGRCYASKKKAIKQVQAYNLSLIHQGRI